MFKIAVASDNGNVTEHFGHCETFMVYNSQGKEILEEIGLPNPGHRPGFLPRFLNEKGIDVIISGGMGASAVKIFNDNNIEVVIGAKGKTKEVAEAYLKGELQSIGSPCHDHD